MVADLVDKGQGARCGLHYLADQLPIGAVMRDQVLLVNIHELYGKINSFTGRVRFFLPYDILFPENGNLVLHQQITPASFILQDGASDDHPFPGFQADLEGHGLPRQDEQWRLAGNQIQVHRPGQLLSGPGTLG